jgi:hypothetical protein
MVVGAWILTVLIVIVVVRALKHEPTAKEQ